MMSIATVALLIGAGGLIVIAVRAAMGNAALRRVRYPAHVPYSKVCADVRRRRRTAAKITAQRERQRFAIVGIGRGARRRFRLVRTGGAA